MTTDDQIAVLARMRELLSDPARVVLDPNHYFEGPDGQRLLTSAREAAHDPGCRVCMLAAARVAAVEVAQRVGMYYRDLSEPVAERLRIKARILNIDIDEEVDRVFGTGTTGRLTATLKAGRAVEVIDAVLADLQPVAA